MKESVRRRTQLSLRLVVYHTIHIQFCAFLYPVLLIFPHAHARTCPNHLNLPLWIFVSTHSMPKRLKSSSLRFRSFKDTPHILLTIILSVLISFARSSAFIPHVSLPYTNTLCTQASYILPFSFYGGQFMPAHRAQIPDVKHHDLFTTSGVVD